MCADEPIPYGGRPGEEGFTLIEAMIAVVILIFGLVAVTNLFLLAMSSNAVAGGITAATDAAAASLEDLKNLPWDDPGLQPGTGQRIDDIPGVGAVQSDWTVVQVDGRTRFITVTSEHLGAFTRARSRTQFTTIRTCTTPDLGCP